MAGINSKLLIVFLCSISLIADAIDVKYCNKKNNYDVKVSGVEITPYPIERGTETTFTISASTAVVETSRGGKWAGWVTNQNRPCYKETPISGGSLVIDVSYYFFGVYSETSDLCTKTDCPVTTGDFAISHSQALPSVTPPGSYTLTMKLQDANKKELTCISFDFSIGWYSADAQVASS